MRAFPKTCETLRFPLAMSLLVLLLMAPAHAERSQAQLGALVHNTAADDATRSFMARGLGLANGNMAGVSLTLAHVMVDTLGPDALCALAPNNEPRRRKRLASRGKPMLLAGALTHFKSPTWRGSLVNGPVAKLDPPRQLSACNAIRPGEKIWGGALQAYVWRIRAQVAAYAQVTDVFDSPRPGRMHNGYDIGLDAGTPIPAGWSGVVTKIEPWYSGEFCVSVQSGPVTVNYGHLHPQVKEGDVVKPGQIIGTVAYDHVDIKMLVGEDFVDWGKINPFPPDQDNGLVAQSMRSRMSRPVARARDTRTSTAKRPVSG
ncbi:MAG: M23 family metallopeptidase [Armatimonadetes bacterium]|nr:M23 family metallopeptidase [Armatimonadota bacterium]